MFKRKMNALKKVNQLRNAGILAKAEPVNPIGRPIGWFVKEVGTAAGQTKPRVWNQA